MIKKSFWAVSAIFLLSAASYAAKLPVGALDMRTVFAPEQFSNSVIFGSAIAFS